jgi:hypothetical protein
LRSRRTRLLLTEQAAFLAGADRAAAHEHGTAAGLARLVEELRRLDHPLVRHQIIVSSI